MNKQQKRKSLYYQRHKDDPAFREHRRQWAREYRANHPEVKGYQREYQKRYYQGHQEELNTKRRLYPDKNRNERVNRFKQQLTAMRVAINAQLPQQ